MAGSRSWGPARPSSRSSTAHARNLPGPARQPPAARRVHRQERAPPFGSSSAARLDVGVEGSRGPGGGPERRAASHPSRGTSTSPGSPARSSPAAASPKHRAHPREAVEHDRSPEVRPASPGRCCRGTSSPPPARGPASLPWWRRASGPGPPPRGSRQDMRIAARCCCTRGDRPVGRDRGGILHEPDVHAQITMRSISSTVTKSAVRS